jgi:hypothetical protein
MARWVAYTSDESKRGSEIFVQSFPAGAGKYQISNGGGTQPRWRRDGKELYFASGTGRLMAVDVKTSPRFEAGIPHELFDARLTVPLVAFRYDVSADGQRFLINNPVQAREQESPGITVVLNWLAGVKK